MITATSFGRSSQGALTSSQPTSMTKLTWLDLTNSRTKNSKEKTPLQ